MLNAVKVADEIKDGKTVFTALSGNGDDRLVWDKSDPQQIKDAIAKFDEMMEKGFIAFLIDKMGKQVEQINKSDWAKKTVRQAEEILFKEPREVHMVPQVVGG